MSLIKYSKIENYKVKTRAVSWTGLAVVLMSLLIGCQTTKDDADKGVSKASAKAESKEVKAEAPKAKEPDDEVEISSNMTRLTYSLHNGALNSHGISKDKAAQIAESVNGKLAKPEYKDRAALVGLIGMQSIAGLPLAELFGVTKRLVDLEMSKDIEKDAPDITFLHLALAAMNVQNYPMAEHFMDKIKRESKNKRAKAGAFTIEGVIALMDDRFPEAMEAWQDALKLDEEYRPALLNIGFLSLRYGDYKTATAALSKMDDDWYAVYGLLVAARLEGRFQDAKSLCARVLSKKKGYRPAVFSCALNEYQASGDMNKTIAQLNEMLKDGKGPAQLDEKAYKVLEKLQKEREETEMKKQTEVAKKSAAESKGASEKSENKKPENANSKKPGEGDGSKS